MNCANHPDRERTAFCQNCGKPLCQECTRVIGSAVFCEPCLAAKLAGAPPAPGTSPGTTPGGAPADTAWQWGAGMPSGWQPPDGPNPGLAALLGFIPGVGAMYNGQYAKGVVHLIVFAILVSLADQHGIFLLFVFGWVAYQVVEAHHTARARRDGTPLPNPFGLNDLGERLGFGKAWPAASSTSQPTAPPDATSSATGTYTPPPPGYPPQSQSQPGSASWSTPWDSYAQPVPPIPPYGAPAYPVDPNLVPVPRNRFPAGALWLIGLGCLFLIGNAGLFHTFPVHRLVPFFLIGLGVWLFVRKMTDTGTGLADDGTPGYQFRLFRALRGSVWVILIGILFLLDSFGILSWGHSWPVIIIVAGLMAIFQRTSYSSAMATPYPYPYPAPPPAPPPPPDPGTAIVPSPPQHDQEGR
jgi:TM2 domain-containing membrane protein YozV